MGCCAEKKWFFDLPLEHFTRRRKEEEGGGGGGGGDVGQ